MPKDGSFPFQVLRTLGTSRGESFGHPAPWPWVQVPFHCWQQRRFSSLPWPWDSFCGFHSQSLCPDEHSSPVWTPVHCDKIHPCKATPPRFRESTYKLTLVLINMFPFSPLHSLLLFSVKSMCNSYVCEGQSVPCIWKNKPPLLEKTLWCLPSGACETRNDEYI